MPHGPHRPMPQACKSLSQRRKRTPLLEVRPHNAAAATGHPGRPPWQSEAAGGTANAGTDGAPGAQRPTPSGGLKQQRQRASEVTGRKGREVGEGGSRRAAAHAKDGRATSGHSQQQRLPQARVASDAKAPRATKNNRKAANRQQGATIGQQRLPQAQGQGTQGAQSHRRGREDQRAQRRKQQPT